MSIRDVLRDLSPPLFWRAAARLRRSQASDNYGAWGDYASYEAAAQAGGTYDKPAILTKTAELTRAISPGTEISAINIRLLAALQFAMRDQSATSILDFGGALGGHYFYLRHLLPPVTRWTVVEMPATARLGSAEFADGTLVFEPEPKGAPDVILASTALQYTPSPYDYLSALQALGASFLIVDRVPLLPDDRWTLQSVHPSVFGEVVAFPQFYFSATAFRAAVTRGYTIVMEWTLPGYEAHLDGRQHDIYRGFLLRRS